MMIINCKFILSSYYPQNNMTHSHPKVRTAQSRTIQNKKGFFAMIIFIVLFFGASYYAPEHIDGYTTPPSQAK